MDLEYLRPSLKMWPISTALATLRGLPLMGQRVALVDVADVGEVRPGEVSSGDNIAVVIVEFVGSADHVFAAFKTEIGHDRRGAWVAFGRGQNFQSDGAEVACRAFEVEREFFGDHGAEFDHVSDGHELGLVDEVISAQKGDDGNLDGLAGCRPSSCPCRRRS